MLRFKTQDSRNKIIKKNERIIENAIDRHFGPRSYYYVKSNPEAVQILLNFIANRKFVPVRGMP